MADLGLIRREMILEQLGISNSTLYLWIAQGKFPEHIKKCGRIVFWRVSDIQQWMGDSE
ncbi:AlpA family phage regulatory protein [Vibrio tritonius]|uniref:AlpA family phage regulatory protein n=1 Tax=Vibrio tritonius TaxID=1435069 RepID=A0ABS7YL94_9VIBR|nr:AlpA family phage regulatory protein [Vibrio tritonius]MCA2016123.1 AlpA family phage regulatory protein [Vibrio tritonius]